MVALGPNVVEAAHPGTSKWAPAAWPLRWKVAAIMVLPVILAMTFGALRIQNELSDASDLTIAANNVEFVGVAVALVDRTNDLAYAAAADSAVDDALVAFDEAMVEFDALLAAGDFDTAVASDLAAAATTAAALREEATGIRPPADNLAAKASTVSTSIGSAIGATVSGVGDRDVRDVADGLVLGLAAQRSLTQERVLVESANFATDMSRRLDVAAALGGEMAALDELARRLPTAETQIAQLRDGIATRTGAYGDAGPDVVTTRRFVDSYNSSAALYSQLTDSLAVELDETVHDGAIALRSAALRDTAIILGSVLVALALALAIGRSLVRSISRLRHGALQVARIKLPDEIERLRTSEGVPEIEAMPVHTTEEIGQLARAVDDIHFQALRLAGEHGERLRIGDMFETLSRRSRSLVEEQLALIDTLERDEDDPVRLEHLFRLDHLTTRMRRNGDNLLVLADTTERRGRLEPVALADVLRAGMSEVEDYRRVKIASTVEGSLTGAAAADVGHLIAELIDNALRFSPPDSTVTVMVARAVDAGYLIEIIDRGLGMSEDELHAVNDRLASGGEVTAETARRMGLFVVGRLARRHDATVRLRSTDSRTGKSGVTASVHVPGALIAPPREVLDSVVEDTTVPPASPVPAVVPVETPPAVRPRPGAVTQDRSAMEYLGLGSHVGRNGSSNNGSGNNGGGHARSLGGAPLPRRSPGASGVNGRQPEATPPPVAEPASRPTPTDTSAFFAARSGSDAQQNRPSWPPAQFPQPRVVSRQPAHEATPDAPPPVDAPPIFQRLSSEWLVDPTEGRSEHRSWTSAADEGWRAAEEASEATVERRTQAGLPVRERGARLVPGGTQPTSQPGANRRDPEAVRANLSRQLAGVRNGRAHNDEGRHSREGDR